MGPPPTQMAASLSLLPHTPSQLIHSAPLTQLFFHISLSLKEIIGILSIKGLWPLL